MRIGCTLVKHKVTFVSIKKFEFAKDDGAAEWIIIHFECLIVNGDHSSDDRRHCANKCSQFRWKNVMKVQLGDQLLPLHQRTSVRMQSSAILV